MQGGCYCGEVRYELSAKPVFKAQCHCRECQYISGGGPNFFLVVPDAGFAFLAGAPQAFTRSDIDNPVTRQFCGTCGTHLTTRLAARGLTVVKVGTLDRPAEDFGAPTAAIFMKDAQPFHVVGAEVAQFDEMVPRA